jgi:hypothetical protein
LRLRVECTLFRNLQSRARTHAILVIGLYTFIACWWGKYENLFIQEYHIPWGQTNFKSIGMLSQTFKNHIHCNGRLQVMRSQCLWLFLSKNDNSSRENMRGFWGGGIWFLSCVITCSDFYPLSNQINLFMVINIWGIIIWVVM